MTISAPLSATFEVARSRFETDVLEGLARTPRALSPKYFYDDEGSRLFDAICDLPEYYLTRTETARRAPKFSSKGVSARTVTSSSRTRTICSLPSRVTRTP